MSKHEELIARLEALAEEAHAYYEGSEFAIKAKAAFRNALEAQAREIEGLRKDAERVANNRDMWKAQCSRQAEELRSLRSNASDSAHSHRCTACAFPYTPPFGEPEDCPQCGWDGRSSYADKAIDAAKGAPHG